MRGAALAVILGIGCSEPLVDDDFQGQPIFQLEGHIVDFRADDPPLDEPLASLFWTRMDNTSMDPAHLWRQRSVTVAVIFPSKFRINVFAPPDLSIRPGAPFLAGQILVWQDLDHDGEYSRAELRGGTLNEIVLYARHPLSAADSPTGIALPAGFTVAQLPLLCNERPPLPDGQDCGVVLVAPCNRDEDCGSNGQCLQSLEYLDFPGGYCVVPTSSGCVPAGGVVLDVSESGMPSEYVYGQACALASDCRDETYTCETWLMACLPRAPMSIAIAVLGDEDFFYSPLCIADVPESKSKRPMKRRWRTDRLGRARGKFRGPKALQGANQLAHGARRSWSGTHCFHYGIE